MEIYLLADKQFDNFTYLVFYFKFIKFFHNLIEIPDCDCEVNIIIDLL